MASLRFVIVLLIALGAAVPALAHSDYCDACLTLAEELFTEVDARVRAAQKENRGGGPVHVEGAQIVAELCTSERMQPYKGAQRPRAPLGAHARARANSRLLRRGAQTPSRPAAGASSRSTSMRCWVPSLGSTACSAASS